MDNRRHHWHIRSILIVTSSVMCWMTGSIVVQHLAERAALLTVSWRDLIWMLLPGVVIGLTLVPTLAERVLAGGEASGTFSTRYLLLLVGSIIGLSLGGMLLAQVIPATFIWPWQASVVTGLLASGLLFVLLRHDASRVRLPSWISEARLGGILLIAMVLSLALWVLTSGPVWTLLAAWPAAAALVSGWLWSIHILVRAVSSQ